MAAGRLETTKQEFGRYGGLESQAIHSFDSLADWLAGWLAGRLAGWLAGRLGLGLELGLGLGLARLGYEVIGLG